MKAYIVKMSISTKKQIEIENCLKLNQKKLPFSFLRKLFVSRSWRFKERIIYWEKCNAIAIFGNIKDTKKF